MLLFVSANKQRYAMLGKDYSDFLWGYVDAISAYALPIRPMPSPVYCLFPPINAATPCWAKLSGIFRGYSTITPKSLGLMPQPFVVRIRQ